MNLPTNSKPHFSIIVPVYNAQDTIEGTLASICAQDDGDFELIVVDDGSTDASLQKMLPIAGRDPRIRLLSQPNSGVSTARNCGVEMARGKLIAFCDSDDIWHPGKLAQHRLAHERDPDLAVSFAQIIFIEQANGNLLTGRTRSTVPAGALSMEQIISENPVCTASNIVVSREAFARIGEFQRDMDYSEDQEWLARAISQGERIEGIDQLLVGYRLSPDGLSVNLEAMYAGWRQLAAKYAQNIDLAAAEAIYCRYLARRALRSGNHPSRARQYAIKGMACSHAAFLSDFRRGGSTLAAAFAAPLIPTRIRQRILA